MFFALTLPWGNQAHSLDTSLVFPGIHPIRFIIFRFFMKAPLPILWESPGTIDWSALGVLWHGFLAHFGSSLASFTKSLLLKAILFSRRCQWVCKPIEPGILAWTGCFSSPSLMIFVGKTAWTDKGTCRNQQA